MTTTPKRTMSAPVQLGDPFPALEPTPVERCGVCAALAKQREEYRRARNMTGVTDCNVEIRQHPHEKRRL